MKKRLSQLTCYQKVLSIILLAMVLLFTAVYLMTSGLWEMYLMATAVGLVTIVFMVFAKELHGAEAKLLGGSQELSREVIRSRYLGWTVLAAVTAGLYVYGLIP